MRRHDGAVRVGELEKLLAAAVMGRLGFIAGPVEVLPEVTEKDAFTAGRTEWSGVGPMRLADMRGVDLMLKLAGVPRRQTRREMQTCHHRPPPLLLRRMRFSTALELSRARRSLGLAG